jgi:hypothetical protein
MTPFVKILKANILNARICKDLGEKELANFFSNQAKLQLAEAGYLMTVKNR